MLLVGRNGRSALVPTVAGKDVQALDVPVRFLERVAMFADLVRALTELLSTWCLLVRSLGPVTTQRNVEDNRVLIKAVLAAHDIKHRDRIAPFIGVNRVANVLDIIGDVRL